jgi:Xaa-Pro aminopeptidase
VNFDFADRRTRLTAELDAEGIDVLFAPPGADLEYLVGLAREMPTFGESAYTHGWVTGAFLRPEAEPLFCLPRLVAMVHVKHELPGEVVVFGETDDAETLFSGVATRLGPVATIAVVGGARAESVLELQRAFPDTRIVNAGPIVNRLRRRKSPEELEAMRRATQIATDALAATMAIVQPGVTMREIATDLERQMEALGSAGPSFETHVGTYGLADRRDNLDPATADLPLRANESVKFDYGAVVDGYCSDFGRTLFCGDPSDDFLATYDHVLLRAHMAAIEAAVPGARAGDVDLVCRRVIEEAGLGDAFIHRTGHCIGLDLHERPFISEEDDMVLEEGMVFTVEPSINVPGRFGMRIEDMVVCRPGGARKLVEVSDELVIR